MLQYLFETCENAKRLAHSLAQEWLEKYMLKDLPDKKEKAALYCRKTWGAQRIFVSWTHNRHKAM